MGTSGTITHKSGSIKRKDGEKVTWKEHSFNSDHYTKSHRVERVGDVVRITDTTIAKGTGNVKRISGTTKTIWKDGTVQESKWQGGSGRNGKFEIKQSESRTYENQKMADMHFKTGKAQDQQQGIISRAITKIVGVFKGSEKPAAEKAAEVKTDGKDKGEAVAVPQNGSQEGMAKPEGKVSHSAKHAGTKSETIIPKGAQVVLKIDEASFVGAKQAEYLANVVKDLKAKGVQAKIELVGDTKQMQSIQSGDILRQSQKMARDGKIDHAEMKEINRQNDASLKDVAETLNRGAYKQEHGKAAVESLGKLERQGRITEVKGGREEMIKAAVESYSHSTAPGKDGERQSALLVASTNKDRQDLNAAIRAERINNGEIQQGQKFEVLTPAKQGLTADSYKAGQEVVFTGFRAGDGKMHSWAAPLQSKGEILSINKDKNTVQVRYQFERKGQTHNVTKDLPANQMASKATVYNREEREFAQGDRLVFGQNDKSLGVQNGSLGEIKGIDDKGNMQVMLDNGKEVSTNFANYKNVDHAYAVTTHKSQGATVDKSIIFAPSAGGGAPSYNSINVGVTRAREDAHIITDNVEKLKESVKDVDEKSSTLYSAKDEFKPGRENDSKDPGKDSRDPESNHQGKEERSLAETDKNGGKELDQHLGSETEQALNTPDQGREDLNAKLDRLEEHTKGTAQENKPAEKSELEQKVDSLEEQVKASPEEPSKQESAIETGKDSQHETDKGDDGKSDAHESPSSGAGSGGMELE
jgi:hypothetical protein